MRLYFLLFILFNFSLTAFPQLIDGYKEEVEYDKESSFGININTIGGMIGGVDGRFAWKRKDGEWDALYLQLVNIKNSKEIRAQAPATGNIYTPGKIVSLYVFRTQYGEETRLFWKGDEDGVRLSWVYAGGLSFGILKPYYIEYDYTIYVFKPNGQLDFENIDFDTRFEAYDPIKHTNIGRIQGAGSFGQGFNELSSRLGVNFKTAINLEFGMFNRAVSGIETGFLIEYFPKAIRMFPEPVKPIKLQTSVFISIYFGNRSKSKPKAQISEIPQ